MPDEKTPITAARVPIADGLYEEDPEPRLLASRCTSCDALTFPQQGGCPRCSSEELETVRLGRRGRLWTWTTQGFLPKSPPYLGREEPDTFEPWFAGYCEFEEGIVVEGRLTGFDDRLPEIGEPLEVTVIPFTTNDEGAEVTLYAFAPARGGSQ